MQREAPERVGRHRGSGSPQSRHVAKLTGELVPHASTSITNVLLSPDFQRLRAELIRVLARHPDAQAEVAAVFRQAGLRAATEMGASTGKMIEALPVGAEHAA